MKSYYLITAALVVIFVVSVAYSHGDEHKKPQKVTSRMMNSETADSMMAEHHDEEMDHHGENEDEVDAQMNADFETIRKDVEDSATFVVIKAVSLAAAIFGLAIIYLPRRKKEEHYE